MKTRILLVSILLASFSVNAQLKTKGTSIPPSVLKIDTQNSRVGIGTQTPTTPLDVAGVVRSSTGGFKFPDGTTQTTANNGSYALPSVGVNTIAEPATVNLTSEGTIDWFDLGGVTSIAPGPSVNQRKRDGEDDMRNSFSWYGEPSKGLNFFTFTSSVAKTITTTDSVYYVAAQTSYATGVAFASTGSNTGQGFRFRVKAPTTQRVLRVYTGTFQGTLTCTGTVDSLSAQTTFTSVSGERVFVWTFNGTTAASYLTVKCELTAATAATPNITFQVATLGLI